MTNDSTTLNEVEEQFLRDGLEEAKHSDEMRHATEVKFKIGEEDRNVASLHIYRTDGIREIELMLIVDTDEVDYTNETLPPNCEDIQAIKDSLEQTKDIIEAEIGFNKEDIYFEHDQQSNIYRCYVEYKPDEAEESTQPTDTIPTRSLDVGDVFILPESHHGDDAGEKVKVIDKAQPTECGPSVFAYGINYDDEFGGLFVSESQSCVEVVS